MPPSLPLSLSEGSLETASGSKSHTWLSTQNTQGNYTGGFSFSCLVLVCFLIPFGFFCFPASCVLTMSPPLSFFFFLLTSGHSSAIVNILTSLWGFLGCVFFWGVIYSCSFNRMWVYTHTLLCAIEGTSYISLQFRQQLLQAMLDQIKWSWIQRYHGDVSNCKHRYKHDGPDVKTHILHTVGMELNLLLYKYTPQ